MRNEFQYTPEMSNERVRIWFRKEIGWVPVVLVGASLVCFVMLLQTQKLSYGVWCLLTIAGVIFYYRKIHVLIQKEQKVLVERYQPGGPQMVTTFGACIVVTSDTVEKQTQYADITKIITSKNLIHIKTKQRESIVVAKNGFTEGSAEECLAFLKEKMKQSK